MQLLAVETPVVKMAAVAGLAIAGALAFGPSHAATEHPLVQRLTLHAPIQPNAIYLTAWADGDIYVTTEDGRPHELTFEMKLFTNDGCQWLGTEHLTPIDDATYAYSYDEQMLSCEPGAIPQYIATPRTGLVTSRPIHVK
ncbi:MAG TPA: hypothetical protein VFQ53_25635 [Kofleriaceae bacterium]|nr:hypothetical protein [Kofleriaceae bacterium]